MLENGVVPVRPAKTTAGLGEPALAFAVAILIAAGLYRAAGSVALIQQSMYGLIACMFLFGPQVAARLSRRPFNQVAAGITLHPIARGLHVLGVALLVTWPLFVLGFFLYYGSLCSGHGILRSLAEEPSPLCLRWHGISAFHPRLPRGFLLLALSQILVVAIPEEVFFRGYLMARLEERWPSRRRLWGAPVGWPLLVSSLLFALGHFLVDFRPARLAVFFPALVFGWMRNRTGSVAPGAAFHALCNLFSEVLFDSFF